MADLQVAFVGRGGDGMQTAGEILACAAAAHGTNSINIKLFGPAVKGGASASITRISDNPVENIKDRCDVVVLFSSETLKVFADETGYCENTFFLVDEEEEQCEASAGARRKCVLPMRSGAREMTGGSSGANIVAVAAVRKLFGLFSEEMPRAVRWCFRRKLKSIEKTNVELYRESDKWLNECNLPDAEEWTFRGGTPLAMLNGNESAVLGAISAGCDFYTGYPITPATYSMERFAALLARRGGVFIQTEDEIAAVTTAIGASFAGARCITATSGAGLSLMQEGLSLAYMAEIPLVVLDVQRGGPSTGLPTLTEQADLLAALHGSHGDAPRVVLAPRNVEECFSMTAQAFRIAEEYQMPVIVLSDAYLATRLETASHDLGTNVNEDEAPGRKMFEGEASLFRRYEITDDGISPSSIPGKGGIPHLVSGLEHDESGRPSVTPEYHALMSEKRYRKIRAVHDRLFEMEFYGQNEAKHCVVCYGSTWGVAREAVDVLNREGMNVTLASPNLMYSHPGTELNKALESFESVLVIELSGSAQFYRYLSSNFELPGKVFQHARPGGSQFLVKELVEAVTRRLK